MPSGAWPGSTSTIMSEAEGFLYSVPHARIRAQVDVRLTSRTVEVFHRGQRVAAHQRRFGGRRHGTDPDHMPRSHRRYAEWTPERFRHWARAIGPHTEGLILAVLASRPIPSRVFMPAWACYAALPRARPRPGGSGLRPGRRDRRAHLHEHRLHPGPQSRPRLAAGRERASHRPSQRARLALLPLTEAFMLAHPTLDLTALGLHGMAKGYQEIAAHPEARALDHAEWLGLLLEHER